MAKKASSASFLGELLAFNLYKRNQGRLSRQLSGVAFGLIVGFGAWTLSQGPLQSYDVQIRVGIPSLITAIGVWIIFRALNYPPFADFLISVEAEIDKVSWASKSELYRATAVVIVTMLFLALMLFFYDVFWQWFFRLIGFLQLDNS
jgi:preprotein translocase subunit SecE